MEAVVRVQLAEAGVPWGRHPLLRDNEPTIRHWLFAGLSPPVMARASSMTHQHLAREKIQAQEMKAYSVSQLSPVVESLTNAH